jgi:hypothetical protein
MTVVVEDVLAVLYDKDNQGVLVEFTKADGTERKMLCTLAENLIPAITPVKEKPETISEGATNVAPTACKVWDLEKQAWRSFRWDSVKTFSVWE